MFPQKILIYQIWKNILYIEKSIHLFADLRLRNEPKNLRIFDLQATKNMRAHLY
jgi:hypothetical protein